MIHRETQLNCFNLPVEERKWLTTVGEHYKFPIKQFESECCLGWPIDFRYVPAAQYRLSMVRKALIKEEARIMRKRVLGTVLALLFAGALSLLMAASGGTQVWKGYVTDTWCGLNRVRKAPTAECTVKCVKDRHAQYAFFNFADKKVYVLNPQSLAAKYAGQTVVVKGTLGRRVTFATMKGSATGGVMTATSISPAAN